VTLRGIHPPIWRRIQVWEDATLAQLHRVLQMVMAGRTITCTSSGSAAKYRPCLTWTTSANHGCEASTDPSRCTARGTEFEYVYDFGDDWEHDLLLEAILQPDPNIPYPRCIAGERNCPPEDVGGSGGMKTTWWRWLIPKTRA